MAVRTLAAVWDGYPGGGTELLALLALADWSDDDGRCWPSIASIAKKTRLSRSQAQRVVHRLIESKHVFVTGNEAGGPPGSTRQYRINLDILTGRMDATPTGRTGATGTGSANATGTGRTGAQDGSHGCAETGRTGATQTVSEPSVNRQQRREARDTHSKGTRIPLDWVLPTDWQSWAIENLNWTPERCRNVAETFADYWRSIAGSKGVKADWAATWRNWCRRENNNSPSARKAPKPENFSNRNYGQGGRL